MTRTAAFTGATVTSTVGRPAAVAGGQGPGRRRHLPPHGLHRRARRARGGRRQGRRHPKAPRRSFVSYSPHGRSAAPPTRRRRAGSGAARSRSSRSSPRTRTWGCGQAPGHDPDAGPATRRYPASFTYDGNNPRSAAPSSSTPHSRRPGVVRLQRRSRRSSWARPASRLTGRAGARVAAPGLDQDRAQAAADTPSG